MVGGAGNDSLTGSTGADTLLGGAGNDTVVGGSGDDDLIGGEGADTLVGGLGNDFLSGGSEADSIDAGDGNDTVISGSGSDVLAGGGGNDTLDYSTGGAVNVNLETGQVTNDGLGGSDTATDFETVLGSAGNDTITGSSGANLLDGADGSDTLLGGAGNDTLLGGNGSDSLLGGSGADSIEAGAGNDTVVGGSGVDTLVGGSGDDTLDYSAGGAINVNLDTGVVTNDGFGSAEVATDFETMIGGAGNDTVLGSSNDEYFNLGAGDDSLNAGAGNDTIISGAGADTFFGGAGTDTIDYSSSTGSITITVDATDTTKSNVSGSEGSDVLKDIENIIGSNSNDTISGNASDNLIDGLGGADSILGGGGADTLIGGAENDTLRGGNEDDSLVGGAGNDSLYGDAGNDTLAGGSGNNRLEGGTSSDTADYSQSSSAVAVNLGAENSLGASYQSYETYNFVNLNGTKTTLETTTSGAGQAKGEGTDTLVTIENVIGSLHNDVIFGSLSANTLSGGAGNDTIKADGGDDLVFGGDGNDSLMAGDGDDVIDGGAGDDTIQGDAGADSIRAGTGHDFIYFDPNDVLTDGGEGRDTIFVTSAYVDFTSKNITNIEAIDLRAVGPSIGNSIVLNESKVQAMVGSNPERHLYIEGQTGDHVKLNGVWTLLTNADVQNKPGYRAYASSNGNLVYVTERVAVNHAGLTDNSSLTSSATVSLTNTDWYLGSSGNDSVTGNANDNRIEGGAGDDTFIGGAGNDTLIGGSGFDYVRYVNETAAVSVNLLTGRAVDGSGGLDLLHSIEGLHGSNYADSIIGGVYADFLQGLGGNDIIEGLSGADSIAGNGGADSIWGQEGNDKIYGDDWDSNAVSGDDYIDGGSGNDSIYGGPGADTLVGAQGLDYIAGQDGDDLIDGGADNDTIYGGSGNDRLRGGVNNDSLYGDAGQDTLWGETGRDRLEGGVDNDVLYGGADSDDLFGQSGNDSLYGETGDDSLYGGAGNDYLEGGDGNDRFNDYNNDETGDDTMVGAAGNDILWAGAGTDTLSYYSSTYAVVVNMNTEAVNVGGVTVQGILTWGSSEIQGSGTALDGWGTVDTFYNFENVLGGQSHDVIMGSPQANRLDGNTGNDTLWGGLGADTLIGGDGNDVFFLDFDDDIISGDSGYDTIYTRYVNTDFSDASQLPTITNIEAIDLSANASYVGNTLIISAATVGAITSNNELWVEGEIGDSVLFSDLANWTQQATTGGYKVWASNDGKFVRIATVVTTDALRGTATGADTLTGTGGLDSEPPMIDYSDQIQAARVNLSSTNQFGIAPNTAVTAGTDADGQSEITDSLIDVNWIKTGAGDDIILGSSGANYLEGGLGNDLIRPGLGTDTVVGGLDSDTVDFTDATGGITIDLNHTVNGAGQASGALGNKVIHGIENVLTAGGNFGDSITGNSADNWIDSGRGADTIVSGEGNDTIVYNPDAFLINAGGGTRDRLIVPVQSLDITADSSSAGALLGIEIFDLKGYAGNRLILDKQSVMTMPSSGYTLLILADEQDSVILEGDWSRGTDTVVSGTVVEQWTTTGTISGVSQTLTVRVQVDAQLTVASTSSAETLTGSALPDLLTDLAGNDHVNALAGDDTIRGSSGSDVIHGGSGLDTLDYSLDSAAITVDLTAGTVQQAGSDVDTVTSVERFIGTGYNDRMTAGSSAIEFVGGAGGDTLEGGAGDDTLYGGLGADSLTGGAGDDKLFGEEGADTLRGGSGADFLHGGEGNDTLYLDAADAGVDGGLGDDVLVIEEGSFDFTRPGQLPVISGIEEFDLTLGAADTHLVLDLASIRGLSNTSDHLLVRLDSSDSVRLKDVALWTQVSNVGTTRILEQDGVRLKLEGQTAVAGTSSNDTLQGLAGSDLLLGGQGGDSLHGGGGEDLLRGGSGSDTLVGGDGVDYLYGDEDNDYFVMDTSDAIVHGGSGTDTLLVSATSVDFTNDTTPNLQSIEALDLRNSVTGSGADSSVTLDLYSIASMIGDTGTSFTIDADASDKIYLHDFSKWTLGQAGVYTQLGITLTISGGVTPLQAPIAPTGSTLTGNSSSQTLTGSTGNDVLTGGAGNDTLNGGAGSDTVSYMPGIRVNEVSLPSLNTDQDLRNKGYALKASDLNNDGLLDFVVTDYGSNSGELPRILRYADRDAVSGGRDEFDFSAYKSPVSFSSSNVYVVYGKIGGVGDLALQDGIESLQSTSTNSYSLFKSNPVIDEGFGDNIGSLGDFDGDGIFDLLIGASSAKNTLTFNEGSQNLWGQNFWDGASANSVSVVNRTNRVDSGYTSYSLENLYNGAAIAWTPDTWGDTSEGRQYLVRGGNSLFTNRSSGELTDFVVSNNASGVVGQSTVLPSTYGPDPFDEMGGPVVRPTAVTDLPNESNYGNTTTYSISLDKTAADAVFTGSATNSSLGSAWEPLSLGDINGDGFDDFVAGSGGEVYFGHANVHLGFDQDPNTAAGSFDLSVNSVTAKPLGDVDGDGFDDFLVNGSYITFGQAGISWQAPNFTSTAAAAGSKPSVVKVVPEPDITLTGSYTRLGDINGDGLDDLLFAAYGATDNNFNAKQNGGMYVVFGRTDRWAVNSTLTDLSLADLARDQRGFRLTGAVDFDKVGYQSFTGVGDMNGDGMDDFIFMSQGDDEDMNVDPGADPANPDSDGHGSSYLIFGRETGWRDIDLLEMQDFGIQILRTTNDGYWTALGDIDGDGFDDAALSTNTNMSIIYGGDALTGTGNIAVQTIADTNGGTLTANAIVENANAVGRDRLIGNAGNDTLTGNGGEDVLIGGAGNDLLRVPDLGFFKIDGGTGFDTMEVAGNINGSSAGTFFNLSSLAPGSVENIEQLHLGLGKQELSFDKFDVLGMTGQTNTAIDNPAYQKGNTLLVTTDWQTGEAEGDKDLVKLTGVDWYQTPVATGQTVNGVGSFSVYQHGSDNIYAVIDENITRSFG